ncbi:hypothetical protein [Rhodoplanes roseus]|uniref:hypothetical protein n=1 Tax=Rhodoplanes roseus TaxID=29409 RepID=UPI001473BCF9|nr:hypothetical protein [Rhodoplanes roseus]
MDGVGDSSTLVLIELVLVLGLVFGFAVRELRSVRRDRAAPPAEPDPGRASARD